MNKLSLVFTLLFVGVALCEISEVYRFDPNVVVEHLPGKAIFGKYNFSQMYNINFTSLQRDQLTNSQKESSLAMTTLLQDSKKVSRVVLLVVPMLLLVNFPLW